MSAAERLRARLRLECHGVVQGVGFRPFVHRLARSLELGGSVRNAPGAVTIELEGARYDLERFLGRLPLELPPAAQLEALHPHWLPSAVESAGPDGVVLKGGLEIAAAAITPRPIGLVASVLAADRAPCARCLEEQANPADRRFGDPFISCCDCGPRFSIATAEPYLRRHTTLAGFPLCGACRREFEDPGDRRFHAETIGCPTCGPRLTLRSGRDDGPEDAGTVIARACELLERGGILALQGVGGFQLLVDAGQAQAVERLRRRKHRPSKPFALLVGDPAWMEGHCSIDPVEHRALVDPAAPIVLLRRRRPGPQPAGQTAGTTIVDGVAPGSPSLGVMLPASPLHHLLCRSYGRPLVATSGNHSGEPICTDPADALEQLGGIADAFLVHNRPIARALDDSVLQIVAGRPVLLRRARGFAPRALTLPRGRREAETVLALGGDLKSAPALGHRGQVWLAPHLGDLVDGRTHQRLSDGLASLLIRGEPPVERVVGDAHPGYLSRELAGASGVPLRTVQHHLAHGLAVMAEHGLAPPLLAVCWDGLGYGTAGGQGPGASPEHRLWGGEFLLITGNGSEVVARLRPWPLPGGELAARQPRRSALGLLHPDAVDHPGARHVRASFNRQECTLLAQALAGGCNCPSTSSVGRLFEAVASLLGLCQRSSHEGEAGLLMEGAALAAGPGAPYPLPLLPGPAAEPDAEPRLEPKGGAGRLGWLDWRPLRDALLEDISADLPQGLCAARFHRALAGAAAEVAVAAAAQFSVRQVALAGGCFQNRLLLEATLSALRAKGLEPFHSEQVPINDGGLALGQVQAAWLDQPNP